MDVDQIGAPAAVGMQMADQDGDALGDVADRIRAACAGHLGPVSSCPPPRLISCGAGWTLEIVATDMSEAILTKARSGLYSDFEVRRGLAPERLTRWFEPQSGGQGGEWRVLPALREIVSFRSHNLLQGVAGLGLFDIILCRNVLIYFDVERKREVFAHLDRALADDGILCLGSSETVLGVVDTFASAEGARGLYRKANQRHAVAS